ncbi:MAG TPA: LysE family translocator [Hyphomicrobiaceae bacterium]|nr:LysE family translocator [Hyphomicrobiaceae bacterium]
MGLEDLWLFILAGLLLNITPGPDIALILSRSTQHGTRVGMGAALGVGAGAFAHIAAAAIGLSAVLVTSATAFTIVKWVGALYLVYLGVQMVRATFKGTAGSAGLEREEPVTFWQAFLQGALTNALNPKVAIFFLAFLPQFVDPATPSKVLAFVTLGLLFNAVGTAWNLAVAWFAGQLAESRAYVRIKVWLERAIGGLFIVVGVRLALSERP